MEKGKVIFGSLLVLCTTWFSFAYSYDNPGYGARATGMGAFVGLADDPSAIFYNPAGIAQLDRPHLYLMYDKKSKFTIGENENPYLLSGVGIYPLNARLRFYLAGSQNGSWADPTRVVTNNTGIIGLAGWLRPNFSVGFNGKFLYNSNYGKKKGVDLDLGLLYKFSPKFSVGVAFENLLATDMIPDSGDTLGYAMREGKIGFAYHVDLERFSTILAWDIRMKNSTKPENKSYTLNSLGIEEWILTQSSVSFGFRGGYTFGKQFEQDINQPCFGLSVKYRGTSQTFRLDYSYQKFPYKGDQGSTGDHRVSLSISFGGKSGINDEYARKEKSKRFKIEPLPQAPVTASSNEVVAPEKKVEEKVLPPAVTTEKQALVPEKKVEEPKVTQVTPPQPKVEEKPLTAAVPVRKPVKATDKKAEQKKVTKTTPTAGQVATPEKKTEEKILTQVTPPEKSTAVPEKKAEEKKVSKVTPPAEQATTQEKKTEKKAKEKPVAPVVQPEKPVTAPEKKAEEPKLTQAPPQENPAAVPEKKQEEQQLAQVIPPENPEVLPEKKIEEKKPVPVMTYQAFNLSSSVEELSAGRIRSIMFMLKPDFEQQIDRWRLYICQDKPSGFDLEQMKPVLLKMVEGKGVPSSGIIWDCRYNGQTLKKGTYYYALEVVDTSGQRYASQWKSFKLK